MRRTNTTNPDLRDLIRLLEKQCRENKASFYRKLADGLAKPKRRRVTVNLSRLNRYTQKNDVVAVPGKVLGTGEMNHRVTVAALAFSAEAKDKIKAAKGRCLSLPELIKKHPKGSNVKIIGG